MKNGQTRLPLHRRHARRTIDRVNARPADLDALVDASLDLGTRGLVKVRARQIRSEIRALPAAVRAQMENLLEGESVDFLFIDGDHTYPGVKRDWELYAGRAKVIAFHDLVKHQPHFGVTKLFAEIKADGYETKEFFSQGNQKGGGIGVVFNE